MSPSGIVTVVHAAGIPFRASPDALAARSLRIAVGISERLRALVEERDIPVSRMAEAVGMSTSVVHAHLRGKATPVLWTLVAYASALRCSLVDLLPDDGHLP